MAEIHEHEIHHEHNSNMGFLMGIVLLIIALFIIAFYLLPFLRGAGTQINIPGKIDINLHQTR